MKGILKNHKIMKLLSMVLVFAITVTTVMTTDVASVFAGTTNESDNITLVVGNTKSYEISMYASDVSIVSVGDEKIASAEISRSNFGKYNITIKANGVGETTVKFTSTYNNDVRVKTVKVTVTPVTYTGDHIDVETDATITVISKLNGVEQGSNSTTATITGVTGIATFSNGSEENLSFTLRSGTDHNGRKEYVATRRRGKFSTSDKIKLTISGYTGSGDSKEDFSFDYELGYDEMVEAYKYCGRGGFDVDVKASTVENHITHKVTVEYKYADGSEAAPSAVFEGAVGDTSTIVSPVVEGYTASSSSVDVEVGNDDSVVTVKYAKTEYTVTVKYVKEDGSQAAESAVVTGVPGKTETVTSPAVDGFTPDMAAVDVVVGNENSSVTVTYINNDKLSIQFVYVPYADSTKDDLPKLANNSIYYTVDTIEYNEKTNVGTYVENDFNLGTIQTAATVSPAEIPQFKSAKIPEEYTFQNFYFYWSSNNYGGDKVSVATFKNVGKPSPKKSGSTFDNYIAYNSTEKTGEDYDDLAGYFAYQHTGILRLTYVKNVTPYTVTWKNYDGTVLELDEDVVYGTTPSYDGETPVRPNDAKKTYTFAGWDKEISPVTADITYTAKYDEADRNYTITFVDGNAQNSAKYHYDDKVTVPTELGKASDDTYTYSFIGWALTTEDQDGEPVYGVASKAVPNVTGDAIYTAQYEPVYIPYTVTFKDYDGKVISTKTDYHFGDITEVPADPTREATAEFTYTFAGWDSKVATNVNGNATYTATYTNITNKYDVVFQAEDGTELSKQNLEYGSSVTAPAEPEKKATAEYTYTFAGWKLVSANDSNLVYASDSIPVVTGNATYKATYNATKNSYTVTFVNGTETIGTSTVEYGSKTSYTGTTPTKSSDAFQYVFTGWADKDNNKIDFTSYEVKENVTVYAQYSQKLVVRYFRYNTKVDTLDQLFDQSVILGRDTNKFTSVDTVTFEGSDLTAELAQLIATAYIKGEGSNRYGIKASEAEAKAIIDKVVNLTATTNVTEAGVDVWYVLKLESDGWHIDGGVFNDYTVTFVDEDNTVISTKADYHVGDATVVPADPSKAADVQYTYTFEGWTPAVKATVDGGATYKATYSQTVNKYPVTFKNYDDKVLSTKDFEYGTTPSYEGTPVKPSDETYNYIFSGWSPEVEKVTGPATYTAQFTPEYINYTVKFVDEDGVTVIGTLVTEAHYGDAITAPADPTKAAEADGSKTYTFAGWKLGEAVVDPATVTVNGSMTFVATYATTNHYLVTYLDEDGTQLFQTRVTEGTQTSAANLQVANPSKAAYNNTAKTEEGGAAKAFKFTNWTESNSDDKFVSATTYVVNSDMTFTANYEALPTYFAILNADKDIPAEEISSQPVANYSATQNGEIYYFQQTMDHAVIADTFKTVPALDKFTWKDDTKIDTDAQFVEWYVLKQETDGYHIDGIIRNYPTVEYIVNGQSLGTVTIKDLAYNEETKKYEASYDLETIASVLGLDKIDLLAETPDNGYASLDDMFSGWSLNDTKVDGNSVTVQSNETYQFVGTLENLYTIKYVDAETNEEVADSVAFTLKTIVDAQEQPVESPEVVGYHLVDDSQAEVILSEDSANVTIVKFERNVYTVTVLDEANDTTTQEVKYNDVPADVENPVKPSDNTFDYEFVGYEIVKETIDEDGNPVIEPVDDKVYEKLSDLPAVTEDITVRVIYSSEYINYTVTFIDYNYALISTAVYHYNDAVVVPANPSRAADDAYTYAFASWEPAVAANVTANAVYAATYTATLIPVPEVEADTDDDDASVEPRRPEVEADTDVAAPADTNRKRRAEVEADTNVKTGDTSNTALMIMLLGFAAATFTVASLTGRKKEDAE